MSSEVDLCLNEISLKDAVKFIVDNRGRTAPTAPSGIALIATNCVNNVDLYPLKLNLRYVSQETFDTWFRSHPMPGDILLTNKGSQNGAICLVPNPVDFCIAQDMVALRADPKKIDSLYLFAALRSNLVQMRIKALNVDAVIPHLKKTDFNKLMIPLPDRAVQVSVGELYFELSSRIELLRKTNATLEAIAQALFKSWFVDFDPVRAKLEGRAPEGMDEATAALFPDSFEESELGLVPRGWRVQSLDSIAEFLNGLALQKFPPTGQDDLPVIKIAQLRKGDTVGADQASRGIKPEYIVKNGDVLFSWSGSLEVEIWCGGEGALNQHLFKVTSETFPKWFYFFWTRHHLADFRQTAASKATTMGHIQRGHLTAAKVCVPTTAVLEAATAVLGPIVKMLIEYTLQAQTLATLRDTLLPRLISGQLRLPEAVSDLEAALA